MKYLILFIIHLYWLFKPKNAKPKCIFKKSCSNYVYDITKKQGFIKGLNAFNFRFKNCRSGFEIFKNPITNEIQILLPTNLIIGRNEIAERLLIKNKIR